MADQINPIPAHAPGRGPDLHLLAIDPVSGVTYGANGLPDPGSLSPAQSAAIAAAGGGGVLAVTGTPPVVTAEKIAEMNRAVFALSPTGDTSGASDLAMLIDAYQRTAETGEVVLLNPGDWWLNGLPTIAQPVNTTTTYGKLGVMTRGYGPGITRVHQLNGGLPCFAAPPGTMMVNFQDMSLIGPELWGSDSVGLFYGYAASTGSHHLNENLEIRGFTSGFRAWQCAFFTMLNCMVWKNARGYELGNNVDGVHLSGGRISDHITRGGVSGAGVYLGWKDATHSPGVVTENNKLQIDGALKFGANEVSFDLSDYWSGPVAVSAYFENETKIAWLGDGVTTTSFTKQFKLEACYFTVLSANVQIEARDPATAVGMVSVRNCRTDAADITGGFLKIGANISVDWKDNELPSSLFQVQQLPTQNIKNLGAHTEYRYNCDDQAEADQTINAISSTCTISNGANATVTCADHKCIQNTLVTFSTTGVLPTGLTAGTSYYVVNDSGYTNGAFRVSATPGGTPITTSSAGSGVHTLKRAKPLRSIGIHSGTNTVAEVWARPGTAGTWVGQSNGSVADVDGKWVLYRGMVQLMDPITALPAASAIYRGVVAYQQGGTGVADTVKCCMKTSADTYSWTTVATGA